MLGCREQDLLGQDCYARLHPDDLAKVRELTGRLVRSDIDHFRQEARYVNVNGAPVWTHLTATMISLERRVATVHFANGGKPAPNKNASKKNFARVNGSPFWARPRRCSPTKSAIRLNSISTTVQLLERDLSRPHPSGKESILASLHDIRQEITRLGALLHEFRFLSRPQNLDLRPAPVDRLVRELVEGEAERYGQRGVKVEALFPAELPWVLADEERIKQALWNVCENAVDAMPSGGTLELRGYRHGEDVCLDIRDTGVGIPDGLDVFELFTTTKANGTGLGLAIARQILSAHGGWIRYETKPGAGTVFVVALPRALPV